MRVLDARVEWWGGIRVSSDRALGGFLVAYLALLAIQVQLAPRFRLAPSDIVLAVALLFFGYRLSAPRHLIGIWHGMLIMLFAGTAALTLIRFGELSAWGFFNKTLGFLALLAAYLLVGNYASTFERVTQTIHILIGSVASYNAAAVVAFLIGFESSLLNSSAEIERLAGGLFDPNAYGGLLVMCLVSYAAFRATEARRFSRWMDVFTVLSLSAGIILTLSRSSWMALGIGLAGLVILNKNTRLAVIGGLLTGLFAFAALTAVDSGDRIVELTIRSDTIQGRMVLNQAALDEISLDPLGMGIGGFQEKYGAIVHNTALWFGADLGIIGLSVFIGFSFWVVRRLVFAYARHTGAERAVVMGLGLGYLTMLAMSLAIEAFYQRHWWVVMALIASASRPGTLTGSSVGART